MADHDHEHHHDPMQTLSRLAGPLAASPPVPRPPVAELEHRARRRSGRRRAAAAMAVLLVLVGVGGVMARAGTPDGSLATQSPSTTEPPVRFQGDLVVYLQADATMPQVQAIRDALVADPGIHRILYESQFVGYWEFRCLFADNPEMIAAVTPDIMPTSFRLFLDGDEAAIDRVAATYGSDHPEVRVVNHVEQDGPPAAYQPDLVTLSTGPVPSPNCPDAAHSVVTGEWIK